MFFKKNPLSQTTKNKSTSRAPSSKNTSDTNSRFEEKWQILQEGFDKLIDSLETDMRKPYDYKEYSTLYTTVYNLCTGKSNTGNLSGGPTELLYDRFKKCISQYLQDRVVLTLKSKQGEVLLTEAVKKWRDHKLVVRWLVKLFVYLDRFYTKHNNRDSLREVGLKCYQVFVYESIKKDMATALLNKIRQERNGEIIDRSIMKDGVNLFIEMGLGPLDVYENDFESTMLFETADFYKRESAKYIAENTCPDYMKKAETRLEEEHDRCKAYLHHSTEPNLMKKVEAELITEHASHLLEMENSGLIAQLQDLKHEDLGRMYRLLSRVNGLRPMSDMMRDFIRDEGMRIVNTHQEKDELDYNAYINAFLDLHQKYSDLINTEFQKDAMFLEALKDAFTLFVNTELTSKKKKSRVHTAELLSTYCDTVMKTTEKIGEENVDELLERIVKLFGYISDKDLFQEYYRRQLSRRLLISSKTSHDTERSMIAKLKMRCGASYTSKLEGMIKDRTLSEELQSGFEEFAKNKGKELNIDFSPKVLTTGFWPAFKLDQLTVSEEFQQCITVFKDFYDSRTESRSLRWVHSLGTCQVLGHYEKGNKDLMVSTYQASVLLLFNQKDRWTAQDAAKMLTLPLEDLKRNLFSLSVNKNCKILKKSSDKKSVDDADEFTVNAAFESKTRRIRVPNLVMNISEQERSDIDKTTQEDRRHAIEAAIVRIMKARKKLDHQNLILETSKQLMQHFRPDPRIIKRRVEDLISREYLARDESNPSLYNYLA